MQVNLHRNEGDAMPVIDVYAPEGLFPDGCEHELSLALMNLALQAEGFPDPSDEIRDVVGTFLHWLPARAIHTANTDGARVVRIHVTAAAGGFDRAGIGMFIPAATEVVAAVCGDPSQADRTWVYLTETLRGGLGLSGVVRGLPDREPSSTR
jgi:hypothetical protein